MKVWYALEIEMARAAESAVSSYLWTAGTTGLEISEDSHDFITMRAWFDTPQDQQTSSDRMAHAVSASGLPSSSLRRVESLEVADQDWLAEWKKGYEPVPIGERLLISPSWKRSEVSETDRIVVEIDPGMAFGTGTHETTRGCLELLERYWNGGDLLDVGTGTGILAISAIKLVPGSHVIGFDVDPDAIVVAEENAEINGVESQIVFEVNRLSGYEGQHFDLILANLTADVLIPLAPEFDNIASRDTILILSGILTEQGADVTSAFSERDFEVTETKPDGEWVSFAMSRKPKCL